MRALRYWLGTTTLLTTVVGIATAQAPAPDPSTRMVLVELYTSQGCDMCPAAEEMLIQAQEQKILEREITALPERQRTALNLCFDEGLSNQEAAEIMGVNLKALQSLIMRAKTTLKERMKAFL